MIEMAMQQWQLISGTSWPLILTIIGFTMSFRLYQHFDQNSLLHPLLIATPLIYLTMKLIELDFSTYYQGNGVLNWLLGPATVALAVPLSHQLRQLPKLFKPLTVALLLGGLFATFINLLLVKLFGLSDTILLSLAAKSVTSPIAIGLTQQIGGLASLLAVATMVTGLIGILVAKSLFRISNIDDDRWQGVILGVTAHAIGTAKAFETSPRCGAFATLGMGINGIWTSLLLPTSIGLFIS